MTAALLCAGQGAQYPGMGRDLAETFPAAAAVFALADAARPETSAQCFGGADAATLAHTSVTQPCVTAVTLACARALMAEEGGGVWPAALAGFSLGEVAALALSGVYSDRQAFELVIQRAHLMEAAAAESDGAMAAVMGAAPRELATILEEAGYDDLELVNFNSPKQTVVSGARASIERLAAGGRELRLRVSVLPVGGAFHSRYMAGAAAVFAQALDPLPFAAPQVPVYANTTAAPYPTEPAAIKETLAQQLAAPVQWTKTIQHMAAAGIDTYIEVGPGKVLAGLVKKIHPEATVYSAGTAEEIKRAKEHCAK